MRIGILTISDLGAVGQRADTSGDAILDWASERGYEVVVRSVVSDETDRIAGKLARWSDSGEVDVVLTTGGTGLTERDVTRRLGTKLPKGVVVEGKGRNTPKDADRQSPGLHQRC